MPKPTEEEDRAERAEKPGADPVTRDAGTEAGAAEKAGPDPDEAAAPEAEDEAGPGDDGASAQEEPGSGTAADDGARPAAEPEAVDQPEETPQDGDVPPETAGGSDPGDAAPVTEAAEAEDRPAETPEATEAEATEPETRAAGTPAQPAPRGGTGGAILAGLIGAVVGFGGSLLALGGGLVQVPPDPAVATLRGEMSDLRQTAQANAEGLAALGDEIEAAGTRIDAAEATAAEAAAAAATAAPVDLGPLDAGMADLADRLGGIDARLTELEKRPVEGGAASTTALEAFDRDMAEMRAALDAARTDAAETEARIAALVAEAEARFTDLAGAAEGRIDDQVARAEALVADREAQAMAEAEAAAREAAELRARAAQSALATALAADRPIIPALEELAAAGVELPADLTGITEPPSQAELEAAFPEAARRALAAALRAEAGDEGFGDRALAFLRAQSGARSLTPREGDDADAILSRAEAALRAGDLDGALAEIGALPDPARAEMADWVERAEARDAVADAVAALAAPAR